MPLRPSPLLLLLFFFLSSPSLAQFPSDYDTVNNNNKNNNQLNHGNQWFLDHRQEKNRPIQVFFAEITSFSQFHIVIPSQGCKNENEGQKQQTSVTSQQNDCLYSTNGGFFNVATGACIGTLVIDREIIQVQPAQKASFVVNGEEKHVFVGFFNQSTTEELLGEGVFQFVSGSGWLVRGGMNYVNSTPDLDPKSGFTTEAAPRTALGVDKNGAIWLVQADGQEKADFGFGLYEFAEVLIGKPFGLIQAINLDGGGSSTSVYNGTVIDYPTCDDTWERCERNVTSITCLKMD